MYKGPATTPHTMAPALQAALSEHSYYSHQCFVEAKQWVSVQRVSALAYSVLSGNNSISNVFLYFLQCFQCPANSAYPRPQVFTTDEPINGTLLCRSSSPCGNPGLCGCIPSTLPLNCSLKTHPSVLLTAWFCPQTRNVYACVVFIIQNYDQFIPHHYQSSLGGKGV